MSIARAFRQIRFAAAFAPLLLVALAGCTTDKRDPSLIEPTFDEPCKHYECGKTGVCASTAAGAPTCLCDVGYAGTRCNGCEPDFHIDALGRCVPNRSCAEQDPNPCGAYGSCDDMLGVIECHCDPGYEGPRCNLCQTGYDRDDNEDCLQLFLFGGDGDGDDPTDEEPPDPEDPEVEEPPSGCDITAPCFDNGECDDSGAEPVCVCEAGYAGGRCAVCADDYERDGTQCVLAVRCMPDQCGDHGQCDSLNAACECDAGFAGARCDECDVGFHPIADGQCEVDTSCDANTCPTHSSCDDSMGIASCTCTLGYMGASCDECMPEYTRNEAFDSCVSVSCQNNPIADGGTLAYDTAIDFPLGQDSCISGARVDSEQVIFQSIDGDGTVWACAPSTLYSLPTNHVFLEAGSRGPAQLIFAGPVSSLSFDYAARSALNLELRGDGQVLRTLDQSRRGNGVVSLTFAPAITTLSMWSMNNYTNQIAIDNVVYAPCE